MCQCRIVPDTFQLLANNLFYVLFNLKVVGRNGFLHAVIAILVGKICNNGNRLVCFCLLGNLCIIHHNLSMEYFLVDALVEVVRNGTDEHALCQRGYFAGGNQAVHLRIDGGGSVLSIDGHGLSFLEYLAETLTQSLGGLTNHLTAEDVAHSVLNYLCLLVAIVAD